MGSSFPILKSWMPSSRRCSTGFLTGVGALVSRLLGIPLFLVILNAETGHKWTTGHIVDISAAGIGVLVSSETELRLGSVERVELSVSLPGHLDPVRLHGVIRNRYTAHGQIRYGIEFEFERSEESQRNQTAIINYVAERQRQHP